MVSLYKTLPASWPYSVLVPMNIGMQSGETLSSSFYSAKKITGQNWSNNRISPVTMTYEDKHGRRMCIYGFMSALYKTELSVLH